jgi:type IV secretion system protein VirB10
MSQLDGPNVLNPRPSGIQKVKKTPLLLVAICFCAILVFLVFKMSSRQQIQKEQRKEKVRQTVLVDTANKNFWFEDSKYDDLRKNFSKEKAKEVIATEPTKNAKLVLDPLQEIPIDEQEQILLKEKDRTETELRRLEEQARIDAQRQYFEAIKSPGVVASSQSYSRNSSQEQRQSFENSSSQSLRMDQEMISGSSSYLQANPDQNQQESKQKFLSGGVTTSNYLPSGKQPPLSRYEVKAGTVIPAALIQGINSDLPGNVTAMVRENVYDTVSGRYLLIPQGAKLIGQYDSKLSFGQNRLLIVWTRLIFPDGASLDLQKMQGVDMAGYAGFKDRVDHHYLRIYGNALLLSVLGAGYEFLDPSENRTDTSETVASNIGRELAQTTSQMTQKNINIQPTIIIRPGYKFNILVMKDMILENLND